mmetsp:Transcript_5347/g.11609  ORF Transcript_5347/g.11609 Transcript_5347/m.11609 type:complete len:92 (-) Transcript_5347:532-807(-)
MPVKYPARAYVLPHRVIADDTNVENKSGVANRNRPNVGLLSRQQLGTILSHNEIIGVHCTIFHIKCKVIPSMAPRGIAATTGYAKIITTNK